MNRQQDSLFEDDAVPAPRTAKASARATSVEPALLADSADPLLREAAQIATQVDHQLQAKGSPTNLIHMGTSSWAFAGWQDLIYGKRESESKLSKQGLAAYSHHAWLRSVGIDRGFYAPMAVHEYAHYAAQVPDDFRFLVKAPALVTDAVRRSEGGTPVEANAGFLDALIAADQFVLPAIEGLGEKAGPLVFQLSPLPQALLQDPASLIDRLQRFFTALPREVNGIHPLYALEIRDAVMLTPRLIRMLQAVRVRLVIAIHDRMPSVDRQLQALGMLNEVAPGPLVVRWSLHAGHAYQAAKDRYFPFNRLVDEDEFTRNTLSRAIAQNAGLSQPVFVIVNNKAEGCAPRSILKLQRALLQTLEQT